MFDALLQQLPSPLGPAVNAGDAGRVRAPHRGASSGTRERTESSPGALRHGY